jgi:hypothetical protein
LAEETETVICEKADERAETKEEKKYHVSRLVCPSVSTVGLGKALEGLMGGPRKVSKVFVGEG